MQLKLRELEACPTAAPAPTVKSTGFDVSKHIRLVPPSQENEVDKYFIHFEKIATSLEWPWEVWTLLLHSVLVGKAQEIYSALPVEKSAQYDEVRKAILKAYLKLTNRGSETPGRKMVRLMLSSLERRRFCLIAGAWLNK